MRTFGQFKGLPYGEKLSNEDFEKYRGYKNNITKANVISHIESLSPYLNTLTSKEFFTGEVLRSGIYEDGDFLFPYEFLHYYKNYDIGIPPEYEAYLKEQGVK
nr:MAG TPA: hypothetical protein [Caudoviricetes sp.]